MVVVEIHLGIELGAKTLALSYYCFLYPVTSKYPSRFLAPSLIVLMLRGNRLNLFSERLFCL